MEISAVGLIGGEMRKLRCWMWISFFKVAKSSTDPGGRSALRTLLVFSCRLKVLTEEREQELADRFSSD